MQNAFHAEAVKSKELCKVLYDRISKAAALRKLLETQVHNTLHTCLLAV